jgi:MPBQ/MSBQ methyltransferase
LDRQRHGQFYSSTFGGQNIPDKATMYKEVHRVLKPGGVLTIYDILAGPAGEVLFPVPRARFPETSFLVTRT